MRINIIYCFIIALFIHSCSVRKYLPEGEKLYKGAIIKIEKEKEVKASTASLKKQLKQVTRPKPNKFLLGQPYKVWWYYIIGEPKREKGIKAWLRSKLGEPPVLSSRVNAKVTAENMQAFLENNGYFHSTVGGDTVDKNYFTKAIYTAHILPQYKIRNITWVNDSSALLKLLSSRKRRNILKPGIPYRLSDIEAERTRLDLIVKTKGYYYFNPDYIMAYADSTIGNHEVNLFLNIKKTTPENARHAYTINRITIFPNYTLLRPPPDTSKTGTTDMDGLSIRDTIHNFKHTIFKRAITYRPGMIYNSKDQNTSLNRLINLGTFKFVKNRFDIAKDSSLHQLNAYYYLTPAKKKSIQAEINGFSKENRYLGTQVSINWKNRNTFKGAELLMIKAYGSFEISVNDSLKKNNNFRIGAEASINFPRYVIPFFNVKENSFYPPRTRMLLGYEYFIKQIFYTKNIFRFQYEFNWKENNNKEHTLAPIAISYLNATNVTDSFYKEAQNNPAALLNIYSEVILGSFYSYTFNTRNASSRNQWYFNGSIDLSGNIAGLLTGAKKFREKNIVGAPFAQYIKADIELRYKKYFKNKTEWANRLQLGIGLPYHNSSFLPFSKQYIIGGSNSIRGFPARTLGPGTHLPSRDDQRIFQVIGGDYKFLINTEFRIPIFGKLSTAVFADIGNVWTKDTLIFGIEGQLKKDSYKELAVASGIGLRYDASVILIRLDLGIPLRKPYLPDGERWAINKINPGDRGWRRDNLIVNIAIGLPF